ncbi:hypothetical protein BS47DRAFT_1369332 [Hydnum rufescens UP504]|uniref:Uncharacterized protein n=1 Tax=Hydnum rufescens UP504 TaxID=1448309 RepID=A0A9P6ADS7_9AGAM|nr:hypothetical protein BS47DRAFT_1369332 [Hydnum rufescens UP504]
MTAEGGISNLQETKGFDPTKPLEYSAAYKGIKLTPPQIQQQVVGSSQKSKAKKSYYKHNQDIIDQGLSCSCLGRVRTMIRHSITMVTMQILHDTKDWCTHFHKIIYCLTIHRSKSVPLAVVSKPHEYIQVNIPTCPNGVRYEFKQGGVTKTSWFCRGKGDIWHFKGCRKITPSGINWHCLSISILGPGHRARSRIFLIRGATLPTPESKVRSRLRIWSPILRVPTWNCVRPRQPTELAVICCKGGRLCMGT